METKPSQRERLLRYAAENYGTTPEYPWDGTPDAAVLRHMGNQKWYGLLMRIPSEKLGLAPALCLVAEDADAGIAAAKAAGMRVIAVGPAANNPDADFALPQGFAPLL